jgi:hypothetical protein
MKNTKHDSNRMPFGRAGAAVVEFAVCLPLLMLLILGSIEATHGIFLKQALSAAAYEGIREGVYPGSTTTDARAKAENVLTARQIRGFTITFTPADVARAERGSSVIINVSAPVSLNSPFIGRVINDRLVTSRAVMVKE